MIIDVIVENIQTKIDYSPVYENIIKSAISETLKSEKFDKDCFVSVTVTDNENIRAINNEHRNIDRATDVLSFPVLEFENGNIIDNPGDFYDGKLILGDIVLSLEKAMEQSEEFGHSFEREIGYLTCHSVLHLLGYDHEDELQRRIMRQKEENVMNGLSLTR